MNLKYTKILKKEEEFKAYLKCLNQLSKIEKALLFEAMLVEQGIEYQNNGLSRNLCDNSSFQIGYELALVKEKVGLQ